jgi:hypothetical protein
MSRKFLITEEEKKQIRKQYGLLTEETEKPFIIRLKTLFGNGLYKNFTPDTKKVLDSELQKAALYIQNNPQGTPYVKIRAGESQVTNNDNEVIPPKEVPPGFLSTKRAETMKTYISNYLKSLFDKKFLTTTPIFEPIETVIGQTPYDKTVDDSKDKKYKDERFVEVYFEVKPSYQCIVGLTVEVRYVKTKGGTGSDGQLLRCRGGHTCDGAIFDVKLNGVKIGTANLNNSKDGGDRSSGPLKITESLAKSIIGDTSKNIKISLQCISGTKCHSSTPEVEIKKGTTVIYHQCAPAISQYGDQNEMMILELDNCGNLLKKSNKDSTNTTATEKSTWSQKTAPVSENIKYLQSREKMTADDEIKYRLSFGYIKKEDKKTGDNKDIYKVLRGFDYAGESITPNTLVVFIDKK